MIRPYRYTEHSVRCTNDHNTDLLLEGFKEVCKALEVISSQLAEGDKRNTEEAVTIRGPELSLSNFSIPTSKEQETSISDVLTDEQWA